MSIVRFSEDSDLFIFGSIEGVECYSKITESIPSLVCTGELGTCFFIRYNHHDKCTLTKDDTKLLIAHVKQHIEAGHKVPPHVIPSIRRQFLWPKWRYRLYCLAYNKIFSCYYWGGVFKFDLPRKLRQICRHIRVRYKLINRKRRGTQCSCHIPI